MDNVESYFLSAIDRILGKGIIRKNSSAADVVNMLHIRYGVCVEIMWYPNIGKWCPNVRTIAFEPRNVDKRELTNNISLLAELYKSFRDNNYYKALNTGIRIAELYVIKQLIYRKDEQMNSLIHDQVKYERITELLDKCDNSYIRLGLEDRIDYQVTQEYLDGSIYEHLTKFINTYGYTTTINEI